jgi:phage/plasmid-like protein (TIGR03299 family)
MHMIDFTTGSAAIAYRGDVPWHGFGFEMPANAPIEKWLEAAKLEWKVLRRPIWTQVMDGADKIPIDSMRGLIRSDTGSILSVVSEGYKVVQPAEILEFFRDLVKDHGFQIETAGALSDGKRVWALARTGENFNIGGTDPIKAYLLLATSYDKQFATTAQFTSVRVVCNNTIQIALQQGLGADSTSVFRVPHNSVFDPSLVKHKLGIVGDSWNQFTSDVTKLAGTPISKEAAIQFFLELNGFDEAKTVDEQSKVIYLTKKLVNAYEQGPGAQLDTAKGTLWGAVNAVTFFADHQRRAHDAGSRMNSAWFGPSSVLKRQAWDKAMAIAEAA